MLRLFALLLLAAVFLAAGAEVAVAQEAWPQYTTDTSHNIVRGPGFYFAIWKLVLLVIPFLLWVKSTDWVSRDLAEIGEGIGLPPDVWNPIMVLTFPLVFVTLTLGIPIFLAGYALAIIAYVAPLAAYVVTRNAKVPNEQKVFTPEHILRKIKNFGKKGGGQDAAPKQPWELGPTVEFTPNSPLASVNQAAVIEARQIPAFVPVKFMIADAIENRADKILLEFTADAVAVRYMIDSVWHNANPKVHDKDPLNRAMGDNMLLVLKRIAQLNGADRRSRQEGKFKLEYSGAKYDIVMLTQGTPTGERVLINFAIITKTVKSLEDLGMREKMRDTLKDLIGPGATGIVVISTMPGDGLTSTWVAALRSTDRLMRDFISIEDKAKPEPDIENVGSQKFDAAAGQNPAAMVPGLILKQPEVMCFPEVTSGDALELAGDWIENETKLVIASIRAKDCVDAIQRVMALKPGDVFTRVIKGALYQRTVRKLCTGCREAVPATPEILQRLGIPAGRVQVLYREKQPLPPGQPPPPKKKGEPEVCPECKGIGYKGRTGIFEILVLNDEIRAALAKNAKPEIIKQLARKAGNRTLQEEAILLIASGVTSLAEVQRVLKQ